MRFALTRSAVSLTALLLATLAGCSEEEADPNLDPSRVKLVNQPVPVTPAETTARPTEGTLAPMELAGEGAAAFTYVASVEPPTVDGFLVQATNFAFDGDYAFVVYNTAGPDVRGGIEVVDLSKLGSPKLVASKVSHDVEFADVLIDGKYAFAVGATPKGAELRVFAIDKPAKMAQVAALSFPARYATSVARDSSNGLWVTTGADGGLVHLDVKNPLKPVVDVTHPLPNALYTFDMEGARLVLGGDADLGVHREKNGEFGRVATIAPVFVEAPGRLARRDHRLYTNAGHTGLTELDVSSDGRSVTVLSTAPIAGTGNGIDASSQHLFLAQGEVGTFVYDFHGNDSPTARGKFDFPDDHGSANQVRAGKCGGKDNLFLSDGLGGFRIVQFDETKP